MSAALMVAERGATVAIAARRVEEGEAVARDIRESGGESMFIQTDVSNASDVEATVAVLVAQLQRYPDVPRTVEGLHDWLYPRDPTRIDADGKIVWRNGVATIAFGAQAGTSLADLAATDRGFLQWVLRKDFSDEVKAIVRDALAGRFPVAGDSPKP